VAGGDRDTAEIRRIPPSHFQPTAHLLRQASILNSSTPIIHARLTTTYVAPSSKQPRLSRTHPANRLRGAARPTPASA
jgi:hypothetical protein